MQEEQIFYEGYLMLCEVIQDYLYYFQLHGDKLNFSEDKNGQKVGCFHMAISEFAFDQDKRSIRINSGTKEFVLKSSTKESIFQLQTWYNKMKESQKYAIMRSKHSPPKANVAANDKNIPSEISLQATQIWGLTSSIQQLIQSLSQRLQNNSVLLDYSERMVNYSKELKRKIKRLLEMIDRKKAMQMFKKDRRNQADSERSFGYTLESISSKSEFQDEQEIFAQEERQALPSVDGMQINIDYADILSNWKNKQLSEMRLPIVLYEPLSFLQRMSEKFQNSYLLQRADSQKDPCLRMAYVVAFVMSGFYTIQKRMRLPFSLLEGQRFDYYDDRNQVHISNSAQSAGGYHMKQTAQSKSFRLQQQTKLIGKFYGNNFEFKLVGSSSIHLINCDEEITYNRPHILLRNVMSNNPFIELTGQVIFKNPKLDIKAEVAFSGQGVNFTCNIQDNMKNHKVTVSQDSTGKIEVWIVGSKKKNELWKPSTVQPEPRFNFSRYALQLNYLPFHLDKRVSKEDSRNRKDIRMLEEGRMQVTIGSSPLLKEPDTRQSRRHIQGKRKASGMQNKAQILEMKQIKPIEDFALDMIGAIATNKIASNSSLDPLRNEVQKKAISSLLSKQTK